MQQLTRILENLSTSSAKKNAQTFSRLIADWFKGPALNLGGGQVLVMDQKYVFPYDPADIFFFQLLGHQII